ncbi:GerAB/ArcD/ProY family transporter [Brevibacillus centrosporus]|uniref:GerAB/ArcD/ProY family transporter n=1 Tax=Brevibacillus centrosporus TaxID=54910 RepID=UPI003B018EC3
MLEKGKITATQSGMILYPIIMSTAMIAGPSLMMKHAMQDMWITPIWASCSGFLALFIAKQLNQRYVNMTIIEQSQQIAGTFWGKGIGFFYVLLFLQINGFIVREYAEFIALFLNGTPLSIVSSALVLVSAFAVRGGVEVIARSAQIFFPFFVVPFLIMILLILKDLEPQNILPILDNGLLPTIRAAVIPQGWFREVFLLSFLLPYMSDRTNAKKAGVVTILACLVTMIVSNLITLFAFGDVTMTLLFPIMDMARYVSVADFFENLESGVMAVWVVGVFVKVTLFYYVTVLGTAQWLNLSNFRPIVLPVGWLTILFCFWGIPDFSTVGEINSFAIPFLLMIFFVFIPGSLLLLSTLTEKRNRTKGVDSG